MPETIGTPLMWVGFTVLIVGLLCVDLFLFNRAAKESGPRKALAWSIAWVSLAMLFCAGVYRFFGSEKALEFLAGYLLEESLSVDNLFVFLVVFNAFAVPREYQHRVLFWGIVGALVMRALFIFVGAALVYTFHWVLYLFGAFLVYTGGKLLVHKEAEIHPEKNPFLKWFRKIVPTAPGFHGGKLIVTVNGRWYATSLFPVLVVIEATDLVFATDSVPAIFGVTKDPFIVYTSNIFAILGLRALYSLLARAMDNFRFLGTGLGLVLLFIGAKMLLSGWFEVPIRTSLLVIALLIGGSVALSLLLPEKAPQEAAAEEDEGEAAPAPPSGDPDDAGDDKMKTRSDEGRNR